MQPHHSLPALTHEIERMTLHLRRAQRSTLFLAITPDPDLELALSTELAHRLAGIPIRQFHFALAQTDLIQFLSGLPFPDGQAVVFVHGLSELSADQRQHALTTLNLGREAVRQAGYIVVFWLRTADAQQMAFQSPDFYAVRSGLFEFDLPTDPMVRQEALATLKLHGPATGDELKRRYLDYVVSSYRWLDFRGLMQVRNLVRLRLDDVFVPPALEKEIIRREPERFLSEMVGGGITIPGKSIKPPAGIRFGRKIDGGLANVSDDDPTLLPSDLLTPEKQRVELVDVLRQGNRLVILGDPGSGKSTLLRYLALTFAEGGEISQQRLQLDETRLPILVPLAAYSLAQRGQPDLCLKDFLPNYFETLGLPNLQTVFDTSLHAGETLLLLDGLDEVIDPDGRSEITRQVETLASISPGNRIIVSSRTAGYTTNRLNASFTVLTVRPQERPQIERFARQWSRAYESLDAPGQELAPEAAKRADARAESLLQAIFANPSIERLAATPLLLTLLALIHYQGTRLPSGRAELYRLCVEALAETWNRARSLSGKPIELWLGERRLDERAVIEILSPVAFAMHQQQPGGLISRTDLETQVAAVLAERRGEPPERAAKLATQFVDLVKEQIGLLIERGPDLFGFMHLTFEEYLAARYLAERRLDDRMALLGPHLHDPRWREVILLTAAALPGDHATDFVRALWKPNRPKKLGTRVAHGLHRILQKFGRSAYHFMPLCDVLQFNLSLAVGCLADDVPMAMDLLQAVINDLITVTVFGDLGELSNGLSNLSDTTASPYIANSLCIALMSKKIIIRRKAALALGKLGWDFEPSFQALLAALHDRDMVVRLNAAQALEKLGRVSEPVILAMLAALKDKNKYVGARAAQTLGRLGQASEPVLQALVATLQDYQENGAIRGNAARSLGQLGQASELVIQALQIALRDESYVGGSAADALGQLGQTSDLVCQILLSALLNDDWRVRSNAARALGNLRHAPEPMFKMLLVALKDESKYVRGSAVQSLGKLGQVSELVLQALLTALQDEDGYVCRSAAESLGRLGQASEPVLQALLTALQSDNKSVRSSAADALGQLGSLPNQVLQALLAASQDDEWSVRSSVAQSLGRLGQASEPTLRVLLTLLNDKDVFVVFYSAQSVGQLGWASQPIIHALKMLLDTDNSDIAFSVLWQLAPRAYASGLGYLYEE